MPYSNIYASCAGSTSANGVYKLEGGTNGELWINQIDNNYQISYSGVDNYWYLSNSGNNLYRFYQAEIAEPTSISWLTLNGSEPAVRTFETDINIFSSITVSSTGTPSLPITGVYAIGDVNGNSLWTNGTYYFGITWVGVGSGPDNALWSIYPNAGGYAVWTAWVQGTYNLPTTDGHNYGTWYGGASEPEITVLGTLSTPCPSVGGGGENAGNNYTHSRIVDAITITGAGGSYTGANGTYYASRNWASGTSEANGDLPIFMHANGNYVIYYDIDNSWFAINTGVGGGALYSLFGNSNTMPVGSWERQDAPTGNVSSTASSIRRFFVRTSGNNAYLRHTS